MELFDELIKAKIIKTTPFNAQQHRRLFSIEKTYMPLPLVPSQEGKLNTP